MVNVSFHLNLVFFLKRHGKDFHEERARGLDVLVVGEELLGLLWWGTGHARRVSSRARWRGGVGGGGGGYGTCTMSTRPLAMHALRASPKWNLA